MGRNTQQRKAIVNVIDAEQRPLSVQEILDLATHECPGLGIATVYRNVRALVDCGLNLQTILPTGFRLDSHEILLSGSCDKCQATSS